MRNWVNTEKISRVLGFLGATVVMSCSAPQPAIPVPKKTTYGTVTFSGLSEERLEGFRVIPETGTKLFVPQNKRYEGVDGFWWKGNRKEWFKIPDLTEVWMGSELTAPPADHGEVDIYRSSIGSSDNLLVRIKAPQWFGILVKPGWKTGKGWPF